MSTEVRVVNAETGGEKGSKLARFDLIPPGALTKLAEHYGKGAEKYADRNWERGYDWSLSFAAMMRHAWAFWNGEDIDPENGMPHLAAVAFHAFALLTFAETHPELDDRPSTALATQWRDIRESVRIGDESFIEWQRRMMRQAREQINHEYHEWDDHGGEG